MRNKIYHPFTNRTALIQSLLIGSILNAIMFLGFIYVKDVEPGAVFRFSYVCLTNIIVMYLLYTFCFKAVQRKGEKGYKFLFVIVGAVMIAVILSFVFSECYFMFMKYNHDTLLYSLDTFQDSHDLLSMYFITNLIKDLIIAIIVLLSTFLLYSVSERQQTMLENERLIADNIRIRYEVLKNQVDPHFLFNSLNTLDGLIGVDDEKAHEFVQNVSSVFRYAINNKEIMHLNEELDFTESYASLMKIRYGDNFQIQYHIDDKYRTYYIMPISLQLLVENAIKHNVISNRHSLIITIETTPNDTIRVRNPIRLKQEAEPGSGIGLANLTERYQLLFQKEVIITQTDVFCVEIPLIKQLESTEIEKQKNYEGCYCRR